MKLKELYLSLIKEGKKYDINELDIRCLISYYCNYKDTTSFFLKLDEKIKDITKIKKSFDELKKGYPLAYLIHQTDFLGNVYKVNESTLIPRPETEELVTLAIKRIEQYFLDKKLNILDVGTGSGVIAIELAKRYKCKVSATDISINALKVAKTNAKNYKVDISFYNDDTFPNSKEKYNVIISNPPYIKYKKDVDDNVIKYEPNDALFISKDNNVYEKIFKNIKSRISFPCLMVFEIAPNLEDDLNNLLNKYLVDYEFSFNYSKDINKKVRFLTLLIKD